MSDSYEALLLKMALERKEHLRVVAEQQALNPAFNPSSLSSPIIYKPSVPPTPFTKFEFKEKVPEPKFIHFNCDSFIRYATGTYQDDFYTYEVQNNFGSYECSQYPKDEDQIEIGLSQDPYLKKKGVIISAYLLTYLPLHRVQVEYKRVVPLLRIHTQLLPFANYLWEPEIRTLNKKAFYTLFNRENSSRSQRLANFRTRLVIPITMQLFYQVFCYYYFLMVFYIPPILFYFFMGVLSNVSCFVRPPE